MNNKEIKQKVNEGWVLARTIIEIIGSPKAHVDQTIKNYVNAIENENKIILKKDISKSKKHESNLYAAFAEIEILFKNLNEVIYFCFDYMPSSIEIEEPEEMIYKSHDLTTFINDLQGRLHDVDMTAKQLKKQNEKLNESFLKITKNFIIVSCINGMNMENLEKMTGLKSVALEKVLNALIKENKIKKENNIYITVKS